MDCSENPNQCAYGTLGGLTSSFYQSRRPFWAWSMMCVIFINIGCLLGFTVIDMVATIEGFSFEEEVVAKIFGPNEAMPIITNTTRNYANPAFTYDLAALFTAVFSTWLVLYGVLVERKYDLYLCGAVMSLTVLLLLPEMLLNPEQPYIWCKYARLSTCAVLSMIAAFLIKKTVSEDRWYEFTITGTSDGLMGMFRRRRFFTTLLKMDFFLVALLGIFCLRMGLQSELVDFILWPTVSVLGLLCLIIGTFAVNREIKPLTFAFITLSVLLYMWVPFQIMSFDCFHPEMECTVTKSLSMGGAVGIGVLATIVKTYVLVKLLPVYKNFGFGLNDAAFIGLVAGESSSLLGRQRRIF